MEAIKMYEVLCCLPADTLGREAACRFLGQLEILIRFKASIPVEHELDRLVQDVEALCVAEPKLLFLFDYVVEEKQRVRPVPLREARVSYLD